MSSGNSRETGQVRLQKVLAQAGIASRRAAEKLIAGARVMVDGKTVTEMGIRVDPARSEIKVDGRRVKAAEQLRYILLYKPVGVVTTANDPQRRRTVMELLRGIPERLYPVGRLDYDTQGLLLLTNDGELAMRLTHPRHGVERTYEAKVAGLPDEQALERLRKGIPLDGHRTLPADALLLNRGKRDSHGLVRLTIREGRNRQVRRMLEAVGHPVRELIRTRIGPITDRDLKPGQWRELRPGELRALTAKEMGARSGAAARSRPTGPAKASSETSPRDRAGAPTRAARAAPARARRARAQSQRRGAR
jgi:pseudouridine synthase